MLAAVAMFAQGPVNAPAPAGLVTTWDIAPVLTAIGEHATKVESALDGIDANEWINKGASPTYAEQLQASKDQLKAVAQASQALAHNPEQLAASLELLIRMQGLDMMFTSVEEAIRKYQGAPQAAELSSLLAAGTENRDRFQQYLVSLAADRERALEVMDKEAQRCRGLLALPAPAAPKTGKKK